MIIIDTMCFANEQIDIFYYIAENSYKKIKKLL